MYSAPTESQQNTVAAGTWMQPIFQNQISTPHTTYSTVPEYIKKV